MGQAAEYTIKVTPEDQDVIEEILEGSPFTQAVILRVALRIGLEGIKRNPMILMRFLGKKGPQPPGQGEASGPGG